jgi:hypothetical protein
MCGNPRQGASGLDGRPNAAFNTPGVERGLAVFPLGIGGECKHVRPFAAGVCFRGTDAARRFQANPY